MNRRSENSLLFLTSRQDFTQDHLERAVQLASHAPLNWEYILKTAGAHGVAPLLYWNLLRHKIISSSIPGKLTNDFNQQVIQSIFLKEKQFNKLIDALAYLKQRGIPVMLIKGTALEQVVYQERWYTISRDIDLILKRHQNDFSPSEIRSFVDYFHQTEIEFDFYSHHDIDMNGILPIDFDRIWEDAIAIELAGQQVWVMSPEDMLIASCINACRKRYLRLKSLFDIAEIVHKFQGDLDWELATNKAVTYRCIAIFYIALHVTCETLGCDIPPELWTKINLHSAHKNAIRFILGRLIPDIALYPFPFEGKTILGRPFHKTLALTYLSYQDNQIWHKFLEILSAWLKLPRGY